MKWKCGTLLFLNEEEGGSWIDEESHQTQYFQKKILIWGIHPQIY